MSCTGFVGFITLSLPDCLLFGSGADRLPDLSDQKQRSADDNQSIRRRDSQSFIQSLASMFHPYHITMSGFRNRAGLGGSRVGDSCNDNLIRGREENVAHLADRLV